MKYIHKSITIDSDGPFFKPLEQFDIPDNALFITILAIPGDDEYHGRKTIDWLEPAYPESIEGDEIVEP